MISYTVTCFLYIFEEMSSCPDLDIMIIHIDLYYIITYYHSDATTFQRKRGKLC